MVHQLLGVEIQALMHEDRDVMYLMEMNYMFGLQQLDGQSNLMLNGFGVFFGLYVNFRECVLECVIFDQ